MRRCEGLLLEGDDIIWAARLAQRGAASYERDGGVPPAARQLAEDLAAFARETAPVLVSDERETAKHAGVVIVEDSPPRIGTHAAAAELQVSTQAIRGLCRRGALAARFTAGRWEIEEWSVAELAARRKDSNGSTAAAFSAIEHHPGH